MHHASPGPVVGRLADPVERRVAQVDVRRRHVDLRPERPRAVGELAGAHPPEEVEVLLDRAVAVRAVLPRLGQRAAGLPDLLGREVADEGLPGPDQRLAEVVEPLEVVRGVDRGRSPVEAEPADVLLDRVDVLDVLLQGVRVVEAEVAGAAVLLRDAEVQADRLGVPDVEVAVRLGREARRDLAAVLPGAAVLVDDLADEVPAGGVGGGARGVFVVHGSPQGTAGAGSRSGRRRRGSAGGTSPCREPR